MPTERIRYGTSLGPALTTVTVTWISPTTITVGTTDAPAGGWTEAQIDAATVTIAGTSDSDDAKTYEVFYDVTYVTVPATDVTAPTGTLTQNNVATVAWSNTFDTDGGGQTAFVAKIFTETNAAAPGFSPDATLAEDSSGVVTGAATSWTGSTRLANGNYRAYVTVAQTVNGQYHWSPWDYTSFTVNVDVPATPTIDVTGDNANARVAITITEAPETNYVTNPSFETNTTGWTGSGATISRSQDVTAKDGSWVGKAVTTTGSAFQGLYFNAVNVSASQVYRLLAWMYVPSGVTIRAIVEERDDASALLGQSYTDYVGTGAWMPVQVSRQFTTGTKAAVFFATPTATATTFYVDKVRLYQGVAVDKFEVQRSTDAGLTWEAARTLESDGYATPVDEVATLYDYESSNGQTVHFRARAIHDYGSNLLVTSDWSTADSGAWTSGLWWLKHPRQPTLNMNLTIDSNPGYQRPARQGVYQALGASKPIVVTDLRGSARGTLRVRLDTEAEQDQMVALLETTDTLLIQAPPADRWPDRYIAVGDHDRQRIVDKSWVEPTFDTLPWIEVGVPAGSVDIWPD